MSAYLKTLRLGTVAFWFCLAALFLLGFRHVLFGQPSTQVLTPQRIPVRYVDKGGSNFFEMYDPFITIRIRQRAVSSTPDIIISNGVLFIPAITFPDGTTISNASITFGTNNSSFNFGTNGGSITNVVYLVGTNGNGLQIETNVQAFGQCPKFAWFDTLTSNYYSFGVECGTGDLILTHNAPGHWSMERWRTNGEHVLYSKAGTNRVWTILNPDGTVADTTVTNNGWTGAGTKFKADDGTFKFIAAVIGSSGGWTNDGTITYPLAAPLSIIITNATGYIGLGDSGGGKQAQLTFDSGHYKLTSTTGNQILIGSNGANWEIGQTLTPEANGQRIGRSGAMVGSIGTTNITYDAADPNPIHITGSVANDPVAPSYVATSHIFLDLHQGNVFNVTLTQATTTLHFTNVTSGAGQNGWVNLVQDGGGNRAVVLDIAGGSNIRTNAAVTASTAAGAKDALAWFTDSTGTNVNVVMHTNFQ